MPNKEKKLNSEGVLHEFLVFLLVLAVIILLYHLIFGEFFPNRHGALGVDYSYFLPNLLNGFFWYQENGLNEVPWFTPAFCGGIPFFPNPQSMYYSVPQLLTIYFDPLVSVYITFLLFAAIGFAGCYLLLKDVFCQSRVIAIYGAVLFTFNGFYSYRMIIGHLTYHAFMLIPLIAYFLLRLRCSDNKITGILMFDTLIAAVAIAYFIHSGASNYIVPAMISVVGIWALFQFSQGKSNRFIPRFVMASAIAFILCVSKLASSVKFLDSFPRDLYTLPGIEGLSATVSMFFSVIFLNENNTSVTEQVTNTGIFLDQHAFEYSITLIPLVVIVLYLLTRGLQLLQNRQISFEKLANTGRVFSLLVLCIILLLPIAVNFYSDDWNSFLKRLPYINNSSSLFRWISIDIPIIVLISSLCLGKLTEKRENSLVLVLVLGIIIINVTDNKEYYHQQYYYPDVIVDAYQRAKISGKTQPIESISVAVDSRGSEISLVGTNNAMVFGASPLHCYEAIFGYWLETFPRRELRVGSVMYDLGGVLNVKNPSCYLFGEENSCTPGQHFSVKEIEHARTFLQYRPFEFKMPFFQKLVNVINIVAIFMTGLFIVVYLIRLLLGILSK